MQNKINAYAFGKRFPTYYEDVPIYHEDMSDSYEEYVPPRSSYYSGYPSCNRLYDDVWGQLDMDDAIFDDVEMFDDDCIYDVEAAIDDGASSFLINYNDSTVKPDVSGGYVIVSDRPAEKIWYHLQAEVESPLQAKEKLIMDMFDCAAYDDVTECVESDTPVQNGENSYPYDVKYGLLCDSPLDDSIVGLHQLVLKAMDRASEGAVRELYVLDDDRVHSGVNIKGSYNRIFPVPPSEFFRSNSDYLEDAFGEGDIPQVPVPVGHLNVGGFMTLDELRFFPGNVHEIDLCGDLVKPYVVTSKEEACELYEELTGISAYLVSLDVVLSIDRLAHDAYLLDLPTGVCVVFSSNLCGERPRRNMRGYYACVAELTQISNWKTHIQNYIMSYLLNAWYTRFGRCYDPWVGFDKHSLTWKFIKKMLPQIPLGYGGAGEVVISSERMGVILQRVKGELPPKRDIPRSYDRGRSLRVWLRRNSLPGGDEPRRGIM